MSKNKKSEETRRKMSEARKKWYQTDEGRAKIERQRERLRTRNYKHSDETKKKMSESRKKYLKTDAGLAQIERLIEYNKTREYPEETRKRLSEERKGSWCWRWCPFKIIAELPNGDVEEYVFDGDTPAQDFNKRFGLVNELVDLKQGATRVIQRVIEGKTKHPWPRHTLISLEFIKTN